jgi:hypothetical protein
VAIPLPSEQEEGQQVVSPFAQTTATVAPAGSAVQRVAGHGSSSCLFALAGLGSAGYFVQQYLNDPYRTLEPFPVDKYLSDYHSLSGSKFKADVKVSADLPRRPMLDA